MKGFCLVKDLYEKLSDDVSSGRMSVDKLVNIKNSQERRDYLSIFMDDKSAMEVNSLFEKKLLLLNEDKAMSSFIDDITGVSKERKEMLKESLKSKRDQRIKDLGESGYDLKEVARETFSTKYRTEVSLEQSGRITEAFKEYERTKNEDPGSLEAGAAQRVLMKTVSKIKEENAGARYVSPFKKDELGHYGIGLDVRSAIHDIFSISKTQVANFDNSVIGGQGFRLGTNYKYNKSWRAGVVESFKGGWMSLKGNYGKAVDAAWAEHYSRENYRNGRYSGKVSDGKSGVKLSSGDEEEITSSLAEGIRKVKDFLPVPVLKQALEGSARLAEASDAAMICGSIKMRDEAADVLYGIAEKHGLDMNNNIDVGSVNACINAITWRGKTGLTPGQSEVVNLATFSVKKVASDVEFLSMHLADKEIPVQLKKESMKDLASTAGVIMLTLATAEALGADIDWDPTSSNFGKVNGVDVTGGLRSYTTLAARSLQKLNEYSQGKTPAYGEKTVLDMLHEFVDGKASPFAGVLLDVCRGQTFMGEPLTFEGELGKVSIPMSFGDIFEIAADENSDASEKIIKSITTVVGLNYSESKTNTRDWSSTSSKELLQFRQKVGDDNFQKANDLFNEQYGAWKDRMKDNQQYQSLTDDEKSTVDSSKRDEIQSSVLKSYNFTYKAETKTSAEKARVNAKNYK